MSDRALLEAFGFTVPAASNGHTFHLICSGCGQEFGSNRRQLPGERSWCGCAECKKKAAALRVRDYRNRKTQERGK
jgi:hypothetical protein